MHRHTDDRFYLLPAPLASLSEASPEVRRVILLYRLLAALARADLRREPNYEEVYFIARQLLDHELREFENPALLGLVEDLKRRLATSPLGIDELGEPVDLRKALADLCNYVHDATWRKLQGQFSHAHLRAFADAVHRLGRTCRAIVTLNHDELVSQALVAAGVSFEDGFEREGHHLYRWRPARFSGASLGLIHLHGSLRWFWTVRQTVSNDVLVLRRIVTTDIDHVRSGQGESLDLADSRPCISLGTHNKVTNYFRQPFNELYAQLTMLFRGDSGVRTLVIIGYGGQDKGVNLQVSDWMQQGSDRRLVIVHPDPPRFVRDARSHLRSQWNDWEARGRVCTIAKHFETVTATEFINAIRRNVGSAMSDDALLEGWRLHRKEMRTLAEVAPPVYVCFETHQLSGGPTSNGAVFAYHYLLRDLVSALISTLNGWHHDLLRLRAWASVLERYDDQQRLELREEFVGAIAEVALNTPYRVKQALVFTAYKALEFRLPASQPSLDEGKIRMPKLKQIVADRTTGKAVLAGLETLDTEEFRSATKNYRNMYHHRIAPGVVLGMRSTVTRIADDRGTGFGFGGVRSMALNEFLPLLQAEHDRTIVVFEQLWVLVREIERELEAQ